MGEKRVKKRERWWVSVRGEGEAAGVGNAERW